MVGFVRSYGKHLPAEAITLNAICPDVVQTNISSKGFYEQVEAAGLLTPMSSVVEAFERCMDTDISGETLEVQPHSGITHRSGPEPLHKACADSLELIRLRALPLHAQNS